VTSSSGPTRARHPRARAASATTPRLAGPTDARDGLGDRGRELLDLLPAHGAWSLDQLVETMHLDARSVVELLSALTLVGLVERSTGGWGLTALGRRPSARSG
jgi:predicted transcriptional regulator